jgi:hypothetical protein
MDPMKLRSFATLLAVTALSACEGDTLLPAREIAGAWGSNTEAVIAAFPDGQREVQGDVYVSFGEDGHYVMRTLLTDTQRGRLVIDQVERGTYTARGGAAELTVTEQYLRGAGEPVANPVLQPAGPYTRTYQYSVTGRSLALVPVCPPNASCIEARFTQFHLLETQE